MPEEPNSSLLQTGNQLIPAGFYSNNQLNSFDQAKVAEHVAYSWFTDYEGGRHPFKGETKPYASGYEGKKYSWAKAPRYTDQPAETGPLAEMLLGNQPLFRDLVGKMGATAFVRQLARLVRPVELMPIMQRWLAEITADGSFYRPSTEITNGKGFGVTQVTRGALGHWVRIEDEKITQYQIITPTAWNLSPRDASHQRGPAEEALMGTEVKDIVNPVELGHIIRSFDPCLVCTVHTVSNQKRSKIRIG